MDNITFHLVFLKLIYGNRKEDCLRLFKMFLLYDHIGPSLGPWPRGHQFHNLGRGLRGHYNHAIRFSLTSIGVEENIF